jgi:hypothetical protein
MEIDRQMTRCEIATNGQDGELIDDVNALVRWALAQELKPEESGSVISCK